MAAKQPEEIAKLREKECLVESHAFRRRLAVLGWTNWLTIVLPAVLTTFAGAAIFANAKWEALTGGAALLSAALITIHKARNCDAYQAECRRLKRAYGGLAVRYRSIHEVEQEDPSRTLLELNSSLATLRETAAAEVPDRYRARAKEDF